MRKADCEKGYKWVKGDDVRSGTMASTGINGLNFCV